MSQTQRCIVCSDQKIERSLWEDEVCESCGRCEQHCSAPHTLIFANDAKTDEGRPHPDAGKTVRVGAFLNTREDPDRARASL